MTIKERLHEWSGPYDPNYEIRQFPEVIQFDGIQMHCGIPRGRLPNSVIGSWGIKTDSGELLTPERLYDKTGGQTRAIADPDDEIQSIAEKAVAPLLVQNRDKINAVVFMSSYPNTKGLIGKENHAQAIARKFGLTNLVDSVEGLTDQDGNKLPEALDWHMACASFADWFTHMEKYKEKFYTFDEVLLVASEIHSRNVPQMQKGQKDPSLAQGIFGDMVVAMRFSPGKGIDVLASTTPEFSDELRETICMRIDYSEVREPAKVKRIPLRTGINWFDESEWILRDTDSFQMRGRAVYEEMSRVIPGTITETLDKANIPYKDVGTIICHQASFPVVGVGIYDGLPEELQSKMHINVSDSNGSSASIPKALGEQFMQGQIHPGDIAVFAGFGAGLHAQTVAVRLGESE